MGLLNETHKYDDIIFYDYKGVKNHPHMSESSRAAQFSPFAALTGFEDQIEKTAKETAEGSADFL
jgi:hypothetical protein